MALEVGIAVLFAALSVVLFAAVLSSFLKWLKDLIETCEFLSLENGMEESRPSVNRKATPLIDEFEGFYGRDADKKAIIDLLISDDDNGSNPGVIPIVGMGGVGKTTLAQHVCNDEAVQEQFEIQAWVSVSVHFDETKVTKEIFEKVTEKTCPYGDLNQLQHKLKDALDGKKFLLVLDDVWSEEYEQWRQLLIPLRSGAKGSKIIVTTRSKEVASKVQTVPTHDLRVLEYEDCWKLFSRHACLDVNSTVNPPELQEVGKEIVRKCGGLPLAAKALGGVLRWQTKAEKWEEVLKSEIWEVQNANILPALAMSYIHLPSHLKRCFAYCAIFPQDYKFEKEKLVALWMSEGFLVQQKGNKPLEEIGDRYFDDLVSRSFFQNSSNIWGKPLFVMHDLVHDLARFVSGEFCSRLEDETSWKIGKRTRHLSYKKQKEEKLVKFQDTHETLSLRSFVFADNPGYLKMFINDKVHEEVKEFIDGLLSTQKLLRVLRLSSYAIKELPNSIGNLKHVRHLDLSKTSIRMLPEAITTLFNLEILILQGCNELVELPSDMARLINLCQLDLMETKLKGMPPKMGKLKKLSKSSDFIVGENGGSSIKELGPLDCLRGKISIRELQNVKDDRDAVKADLKDKEKLKALELIRNKAGDASRQVKVLERLKPNMQIESIKIWGYGGTEFPNWVGDISFSKLKQLYLEACMNCICLPPIGQLVSLESLSIEGSCYEDAALETIGLKFYGMCKPGEKPFSSVKRLEFRCLNNWREWSSFNGAFPVLEELRLTKCPELMSVPNDLPSLKRLWIWGCSELDIENLLISTCATLETIYIWSSEKVKCISLETFPNLKELTIRDCDNLKSLVGSTTTRKNGPLFFPFLTSLHIESCFLLVSFPRGGLHAPHLKKMKFISCRLKSLPQGVDSPLPSLEVLEFRNCPELMSVSSHLPSLKLLRIIDCGELDFEDLLISTCATLETIHISGSKKGKCISLETFPNLKVLDISACANLESLESLGSTATTTTTTRKNDPLFSPSFTKLTIYRCPKLVSFPNGGLYAPNLKSMKIGDCDNLKSLPQGMHSLLPSLDELRISNCPEIESLPEVGLPPKLQALEIIQCEKLVESSFLEKTLLPSSLEHLYVKNSEKMKSLNYEGLQRLSLLESLIIDSCNNLESLPEEGLPSSPSYLELRIPQLDLAARGHQEERGVKKKKKKKKRVLYFGSCIGFCKQLASE